MDRLPLELCLQILGYLPSFVDLFALSLDYYLVVSRLMPTIILRVTRTTIYGTIFDILFSMLGSI